MILSLILPVLAFLLAVAVISYIAYPLVSTQLASRGARAALGAPNPADELFARRDRVYGELRELDFDYRVGKVSPEDYHEIKSRLETEGARILRAIDVELKEIDDEIEREVKLLRAKGPACPACGAAVSRKARFCVQCGAALTVVAGR